MKYSLNVNGKNRAVEAEPEMPLLWALRDSLNETGTKFGCGVAVCGACLVLVDGQPVPSCQTRLKNVGRAKVVTIEGLAGREARAVQQAWRELDVVQCGWCQSGQIVSATALLTRNASPTDAQIDSAMNTVLCRCGTYQRVRAAIHRAAAALASKGQS